MPRLTAIPVSFVAGLALLGSATASHATFMIDPSPTGTTTLNLTQANSATTDLATVFAAGDVTVTTNTSSDFASGAGTIKPTSGLLTTLTFTPTASSTFGSFSFRGQDLVSDQTIVLTVVDNQGSPAQTFDFTGPGANADIVRSGIISLDGETIKSVTLFNSGGFTEAKQFAFGGASAVPEPATWALMLIGFGGIGGMMRSGRKLSGAVAA